MTTKFVVLNTITNQYFKRGQVRSHWDAKLVSDINRATVYDSRGAALNSVGVRDIVGTNSLGRPQYSKKLHLPIGYEILPVTLTVARGKA